MFISLTPTILQGDILGFPNFFELWINAGCLLEIDTQE